MTDEDKNVRCQNLRVPHSSTLLKKVLAMCLKRKALKNTPIHQHAGQVSGNEEFSRCAPFRIGPEHKFENWEIPIARIMNSLETLFSLFPIYCRFLKLDSLKPTPFRDSPGRLLAVKEMTRLGAG